jgi:phosphoribosylamine---glycine ligase
MNILLLGSGGREHAMAWKLSQSKKLSKLFIAPGNAGTSKHGENVSLSPLDFKSVGQFCLDNQIAMLIVGPEEPLVKGIRDYFENAIRVSVIFRLLDRTQKGPCWKAARILQKTS